MRTLTSNFASAVAGGNVIPVMMVALDFGSGRMPVHTGVGSFDYAGMTFVGVGTLGKLESIDEGSELQAYGVKMSLRGVPNNVVSIALGEHYQGRSAWIWAAALTEAHVLIGDPVLVFSGRMDNMQIQLGPETAEVELTAENRLIDWDRPRTRRYNDADQQAEYHGDLGFQFVEQMVNKTLFWGRISSI